MKYNFCVGKDLKSTKIKNFSMTFEDMIIFFSNFKYVETKSSNETEYFLPCIFEKEDRRDRNYLKGGNILSLDLDKSTLNFTTLLSDIKTCLQKYSYIIYSTHSHTEILPRLRIILLLSREVNLQEYKILSKNFINALSFSEAVDYEASTQQYHCFNLPSYSSVDYNAFFDVLRASEIDVESFLIKDTSEENTNSKCNNSHKKIYTKENVLKILSCVNSCETDYYLWLKVGFAISFNFSNSDEGLKLWQEWSLQDTRYSKEQILRQTQEKWNSFNNSENPVTFSSIKYLFNLKSINKLLEILKVKKDDGTINAILDVLLDMSKEHQKQYFLAIKNITGKDVSNIRKSFNIVRYKKEREVTKEDIDKDFGFYDVLPVGVFPRLTENNKIMDSYDNFKTLLKYYNYKVYYDVIKKKINIDSGIFKKDSDLSESTSQAEIIHLLNINSISTKSYKYYLSMLASELEINILKDWICSKEWDGISRRKQFYNTITADTSLKETLMEKWMLSIISSNFSDEEEQGFWSKGVLVLQGAQSMGKSSWVKSLLPSSLSSCILEGFNLNVSNKDSMLTAIKYSIVELAEVGASIKKQEDEFKAFISRSFDSIRAPYSEVYNNYRRRTVFVGSVDRGQFISDVAGDVRYWTLKISDIKKVKDIELQQLYAEYLHMFNTGCKWYLTKDEEKQLQEENAQFRYLAGYSIFQDYIRMYYEVEDKENLTRTTAAEMLKIFGYTSPSRKVILDFGIALNLLGFEKTKNGYWLMPPLKSEYKNIF